VEIAKLVVEYLRVALSAQTLAAVVAIVFFLVFKEDFRALMRRIAKIRFPGGSELSTSQVERSSENVPAGETEPPLPPAEQVSLPQNLSLTPEQIDGIRQLFEAERAKAYLWEYRFLNYFLVPNTQRALDWLAALPNRTSVSLFDALWLPSIPSADERKAIIGALQAHHLILFTGPLIEVTPKGREYIQWRGPLPPVAT